MDLTELSDMERTLESYIDKISVPNLLEAVSRICIEKAQHIRENWQDESMAMAWEKNGYKIMKCITKLDMRI